MAQIQVDDKMKSQKKQPVSIIMFGQWHTVMTFIEGVVEGFELGGQMVKVNGLLYPTLIFIAP